MRSTLKMPKVGDAVDQVVVAEIGVVVGAAVTVGQTLLVVETDKAKVEVPSPVAGNVREILVATGEEVRTGAPILVIDL